MKEYTLKSCLHCNRVIPKKRTVGWPRYQQRQFCNRQCHGEYAKFPAEPNRRCLACDKPITQKHGEIHYFFRQRVYCNKKCVAFHKRSQLFDGHGNKWCSACQSWKPLAGYTPKHRINGPCNTCCAARIKARKDKDPAVFNAKRRARKDKIESKLKTLLREARTRAIKGGFPFNLTIEHLLEQWNDQNGYCFYSGLLMTNINDGSNHRTEKMANLSIDRIEPARGYTIGNVVFCRYAVNTMKMVLSVQDFLNYASAIAGNADAVIEKLRLRNSQ